MSELAEKQWTDRESLQCLHGRKHAVPKHCMLFGSEVRTNRPSVCRHPAFTPEGRPAHLRAGFHTGGSNMASRREWLGRSIVLLFLLLYTVTAGVIFCFNTLILYIEKDFKIKLALLELLGGLPASVQGLAAPVAMWLSFRIGTWPTVATGTVLTTLGLILAGFSRSVDMLFFTYGGITSIGILLLINPPFFLIDQIYPYDHPRHVLATSITSCGLPLAALIFNPVSNILALSVGWHHTYIILAVALLTSGAAWTVAAFIWLRAPAASQPLEEQQKEEQGGELGQVEEKAGDADEDKGNIVQVSASLKAGICMLWTAASICKCIAYYTPLFTLLKHMDTAGIPRSLSWQVMPVIGASELLSHLVASWAGDYYKRSSLYMYAGACFILAVINMLGSMSQTYVHFMLYGAGLGIFGGPIIASLYSCSSEVLYGQQVPLIFSLFRIGIGIACLLGPVIAGGFHDELGTFHPIFYLCASLYLISSIIYIIIILINKYHRPGTNTDKQNVFDSETISYHTLHNQSPD